MNPTISVVVPSFNAAEHIGEAIQSVLNQGFDDLEIVIQDGGSTDGTAEVVRGFADERMRFFQAPDRGQSHALNMAVEKARGEWIVWLNADDTLAPCAISTVAGHLGPDLDLILGDFRIIDAASQPVKSYHISPLAHQRLLKEGCYPFSGAAFWRRTSLLAIQGVDESLHYVMDFDLFLRGAGRMRTKRVDGELAYFRRHTGGKTTDSPWPMFREALKVRFRNCRGLADVLYAGFGTAKLTLYLLSRSVWHSRSWRSLRPSKTV